MKKSLALLIISIWLFSSQFANGQEQKNTTIKLPDSGTKAQDYNSSRSNKTASSVAPDANQQVEGQNSTDIKSDGDNAANSKKGYDYYKAKSELNSAKSQTKTQDHNSSRSNKTSSIVAPNNPETGGNSDKKENSPDDKTDKSEAARAKKK